VLCLLMSPNMSTNQYITADSFFDRLTKLNFSVFHLNIRSFNKNFDELSILFRQFNNQPNVIVLTETWFSPDCKGSIDGYTGYHVIREDRRGGGVSVFVDEALQSKICQNYTYENNQLEICSVQVELNDTTVNVLGIYRAPDKSIPGFSEEVGLILSSFGRRDHVLVVGDLNVDLRDPNVAESDVLNTFYAASYLPLITAPTHISSSSESCIDHIWYNQLVSNSCGVIEADITDHYPITAIVDVIPLNQEFIQKSFRDHSNSSLVNFRNALLEYIEQFCILESEPISEKTAEFLENIYKIYDKCCPIRIKQVSRNRILKPWITKPLINCINTKHRLFRQYKRGETDFRIYNIYKNLVTSQIKQAKMRYFRNKFNSNLKNARETWKCINSLTDRNKKKESTVELVINNEIITDPTSIADSFNTYFANVGPNLDRNIPETRTPPTSYMGPANVQSFFVGPATAADVEIVLKSLRNVGGGLHSIPVFIMKHCADILCPILSELFNKSVSAGVFPDCLKTARVIPVYKSGDKNLVNNYRPISILTTMSKIYEKLMYKRLISFMNVNKLLNNNQFGFRMGSSTSDAILEFLDNVYNSLSNKSVLIAIFLDFSKAFDTVNHSILLKKLSHLGIRGIALDWFRSYLTNRKQYVSISGGQSSESYIRLGVPQGSVLGPVLFLLYINDMCNCSRKLNFVHFADDTTAFRSGVDIDRLVQDVNTELVALNDWLCCNRLSLNLNKTSYMLFTDRKCLPEPIVRLSRLDIQRVSRVKFLGILMDDRLTFSEHTSNICKQVSKSIGMLNRISSIIPIRAKSNIYYSLIYSRISYGIVSYGRGNVTVTEKLNRLIIKSRKIINYSPNNVDTPIRILSFTSMFEYFTAIKFYKIIKLNQHSYFRCAIDNLLPVHNHSTRFNNLLQYNVPFYSKSKCQKSFLNQSIAIWNNLPYNLKQCNSFSTFKRELKQLLLTSETSS